MPDDQNQESQQEFFGFGDPSKIEKPERLPTLAKSQKPVLISATSEHILVAGILLILAFCGVFFLGVMRGKNLAGLRFSEVSRTTPPTMVSFENRRKTPVVTPTSAPKIQTAAPATARPRTVVIADPTKPYTLQLVTHKKREYTEAELQILKQKGYSAFIQPKGDYFLVCYGQYASKESAKKDLAALRVRYKDCFLTRR